MSKTTTKKRIFIANDASILDTGYGVYGKEIISRIHNSDKYTVAELGCYCDVNDHRIKNIPWKFYANAIGFNDPRVEQYKSNHLNQFGMWRFNRCLIDFKPHIVFDIRDYWMYFYQDMSPYRHHFNWIIMPTTDSNPPKIDWLYTYQNAELVVPYTQWAKDVLTNSCGNRINLFPKIANAGINPNEFFPIENKTAHKLKFFGKDLNIIGLVMRNQKRKLIADMLIAFKNFLQALKDSNQLDIYEKTYLYLHTSYPEENGWYLPALLLEFDLLDKVYFTYRCKQCGHFHPSKFRGGISVCQKCNNRSVMMASPSNGINTAQLNEIYNLFDIFIQYAICEGFGMPQVEAAACGLQIAAVDHSAMTEIVKNLNGIPIPVQKLFREMEINADRAYPDNNFTSQMLYNFFVNTSQSTKEENSKIIREKCISLYTWDNVYKVWEEAFDSVDIDKKIPWDSKNVPQVQNMSVKVPADLTNKEFIEFICLKIINDPHLLKTANIQILIKELTTGIVAKNGGMVNADRGYAIEVLESLISNKINCERMRLDPNSIMKEDFI
jgi:glycosyltransferase involved in cell wall biosynthesis